MLLMQIKTEQHKTINAIEIIETFRSMPIFFDTDRGILPFGTFLSKL